MTSGADGDSYHSGGFLFRVMSPSWQAAPAGIRNGHSAGGPFFFAATKIRIGRKRSLPLRPQQAKPFSPASIPKSGLEIKNHCTLEDVSRQKPAVIPKFGPEIKNHCTLEGVSRQNHAVIPKLTPSNQESLHAGECFQAKTCSDS